MSNLPRQVREAEERSDAALKALHEAHAAANAPAAPTEPASNDTPPASAITAATPPVDPAAPAPPAEIKPPADKDYKAMYFSLQGKYNAEVPRLQTDLKARDATIAELNEQLAALKQAPPKPQDAGPSPLTEKYGADTVAMVRAIQAEAIAEVRRELEPVKQGVADVTTRVDSVAQSSDSTSQEIFLGRLTELAPKWREQDRDERFDPYLEEQVSKFDRRTRRQLLTEAYQRRDASLCAEFFLDFEKRIAPPPSRSESLSSQQVPAPSGSTTAPPTKPIITKAQVQETFKNIALGKYPAAKAAELEREIDVAAAEGRIR